MARSGFLLVNFLEPLSMKFSQKSMCPLGWISLHTYVDFSPEMHAPKNIESERVKDNHF